MIAAISGGAGDAVYAIPTLRALNVTTVYVKKNFYHLPHGNLHQTMKRLMESQGFECLPTSGAYPIGTFDPALKFDYNIDHFRKQHDRGRIHIMDNIARHFGVTVKHDPWLHNIPKAEGDYSVIHLTDRWRTGSKVDWKRILNNIPGKVYFAGLLYEWQEFAYNYGNVEWFATDDIFDLAILINGAGRIYCNQSVGLVLAQGLGKEYWLDKKPNKTNTLLYGKNEHIL